MDWLVESGGYLGIVLFLVLTGCGLPIPEEVPIVLAGVFSSQGDLDPRWAFAACLFGALLGDSIMYSIGYHFGHGLLVQHPKCAKFLHAEREAYFEQAIQRHGFKVMLLARFMVGIRGPTYLAAGVVRVPFRKFFLWDLICATLVVGTFFSLSYAYGDEITRLVRNAEVGLTLLVVAVAVFVGLWWIRRRKQGRLDEALARKLAESSESESDAQGSEQPGNHSSKRVTIPDTNPSDRDRQRPEPP